MFLGGADQSKAELRAASIKGLSRFVWSPGNKMLKATKNNLKAELKVSDKNIVPTDYHEILFVKKKSVTANVAVEKIGNAFRIIKIS